MEVLSDKDEEKLDNKADYYINCSNQRINIESIIGYGKINVNDPEDIDFIKTKLKVPDEGFIDHASFNYERGTVSTDERGYITWYHNWDAVRNFKLKHCVINKSEKVIIYKENVKRIRTH